MRSFAISLVFTAALGLLSGAAPVKPVDGSLPVVPPKNSSPLANASVPVPPSAATPSANAWWPSPPKIPSPPKSPWWPSPPKIPTPPKNASVSNPPKEASIPAPPMNGTFPAVPPKNGSLPASPANATASAGGALGDLPLATVIKALGARSTNVTTGNASQSIEAVWVEMWTEVSPLAQSLLFVNKQNCTAATVKPILGKIITPLNATLSQLVNFQHLGLSAETLLTAVDGVSKLTAGGLAVVIGGDLAILFKALYAVLTTATGDIKADLVPILTSVGILVGQILTVVLSLVAGLLAALGPILIDVAGVLNSLGLGPIFAVLGFKL